MADPCVANDDTCDEPDRVGTNAATTDLTRIFREEWAGVVATLARRLDGDLEAAEDAVQEALVAAARTWPRDGVPSRPGAWLNVTAWRKAVDRIRHDRLLTEHSDDLSRAAEVADDRRFGPRTLVEDDLLQLIFTCCDPALPLDARIALTLRFVAGLTTREIAHAFLVPEPTLGQRLVRAKRKIRRGEVAFTVPDGAELEARLPGVLSVVYLVFNEGYAATGGVELVRGDLCDEAIWLGSLLHRLLPNDPEIAGLLALMQLHHARAATRKDSDGRPLPLSEQDRSRWDRSVIDQSSALLDSALEHGRPGAYQIQAAIAAVHAQAPSFEQTDWVQISALYSELARVLPSPVVEINRAVAVGMAEGPSAGLALLEPILASDTMADYAPLHSAHANLLDRLGETAAANTAWRQALAATRNDALHTELSRRISEDPL
ncbi:sigma-70 family RNA polymerase sigma factor [Nocardia sp. NPDC050793]|uniref:RNA polymerase sigma factor n=1 Tax=Nocardia sp. NPDC050793 TaxID=3155159 RepID=UPI0033DA6629